MIYYASQYGAITPSVFSKYIMGCLDRDLWCSDSAVALINWTLISTIALSQYACSQMFCITICHSVSWHHQCILRYFCLCTVWHAGIDCKLILVFLAAGFTAFMCTAGVVSRTWEAKLMEMFLCWSGLGWCTNTHTHTPKWSQFEQAIIQKHLLIRRSRIIQSFPTLQPTSELFWYLSML